MHFTAHNIELSGRKFTISADEIVFEERGLCRAVVGAVQSEFDGEDLSGVRVADLGSLEGGYRMARRRPTSVRPSKHRLRRTHAA